MPPDIAGVRPVPARSLTAGPRIGRRDRERVPLTRRELDVVRAIARGRTNAEIAGELFLAVSTVKTHVGNVGAKLSARNRVEIAVWAWEHGLVSRGGG